MRAAGVAVFALLLTGHVGSPYVFFSGKAGPYDVGVVVRPPEVVPGVARVTVRADVDVRRVGIRPIFWRAGSRGAPSADETRRLEGSGGTFEGSLWLMTRGAYSVDVIVEGARGTASVQVPVASVATGRLAMGPGLGAILVFLGLLLCAGLVNIVYKSAGESLVDVGGTLERARASSARRVAALSVPIIALILFGGARWWRAVDQDYRRTIYRPSPLRVDIADGTMRVATSDTVWRPPRRPAALMTDHGKLMHLFLVRAQDATAFAHLHPVPLDSSLIPEMATRIPPLPAGDYHVFGDVVHETGFERTLVANVTLDGTGGRARGWTPADRDDAWHVGEASRTRQTRLADGSIMEIAMDPNGVTYAGRELAIRVRVRDSAGRSLALEPYLGMRAHAVVMRLDGAVYVHLHPMGTVTPAAQAAFAARDRGDTTETGALRPDEHALHAVSAETVPARDTGAVEFPYAFPRAGAYRLFVQVSHGGRILTGAFAVPVADSAETP